jgi:hypothetical protein
MTPASAVERIRVHAAFRKHTQLLTGAQIGRGGEREAGALTRVAPPWALDADG